MPPFIFEPFVKPAGIPCFLTSLCPIESLYPILRAAPGEKYSLHSVQTNTVFLLTFALEAILLVLASAAVGAMLPPSTHIARATIRVE